jgi:hypothetical protein
MNQLLSIEDAVRVVLAISPWTIRSFCRSRKLRPLHIGRRVLLEEAEICRFLYEAKGQQIVPLPSETIQTL